MNRFVALVAFVGLIGLETAAHADTVEPTAKCRDSGDTVACAIAAFPLEASAPETALELQTVACAKHPDQCTGLVAFAQRTLKKRDTARAVAILEKGCDLKGARACAMLASELEEGERGIASDVTKAARLHDKACELGAARSCFLLAVMADDGRGIRRDPARAQKLRARGELLDKPASRGVISAAQIASDESQCRKSQDASRCISAGTALQETDAVKAEELFRLGCNIDKPTCGLWGFAYDRLRRDDPSRGTRILEEGCNQGAGVACTVLADLNHTGFRSILRNEGRAAELYDKACTFGEPGGCRATAARYRGVRNAAKADELRDRAWTLEADADKPVLALQEAWLKDAAQNSLREPFVRELERRRSDWHGMTQRARARWDLRLQRLAAVDAGNDPGPLPPAPASDAEGSKERSGAIQRMSKTLFP